VGGVPREAIVLDDTGCVPEVGDAGVVVVERFVAFQNRRGLAPNVDAVGAIFGDEVVFGRPAGVIQIDHAGIVVVLKRIARQRGVGLVRDQDAIVAVLRADVVPGFATAPFQVGDAAAFVVVDDEIEAIAGQPDQYPSPIEDDAAARERDRIEK